MVSVLFKTELFSIDFPVVKMWALLSMSNYYDWYFLCMYMKIKDIHHDIHAVPKCRRIYVSKSFGCFFLKSHLNKFSHRGWMHPWAGLGAQRQHKLPITKAVLVLKTNPEWGKQFMDVRIIIFHSLSKIEYFKYRLLLIIDMNPKTSAKLAFSQCLQGGQIAVFSHLPERQAVS